MTKSKNSQSTARPNLKRQINSQSGFALIVVLAVILLVTALAMLSFNTSDTDRKIASNTLDNTRAYYAAEAGIIQSMAMLTDSLWRTGFDNAAVGNANYSVQVIDSSTPGRLALKDSIILRSTGIATGSSQSQIDVLMAPFRRPRFKWAVFGDTAVRTGGGCFVDSYNSDSGTYAAQAINGPDSKGNMYASNYGDVGSNYTIDLANNSIFHGNVSTPDTVLYGLQTVIDGSVSNSAPTTILPPISSTEMNWAMSSSKAPGGLTLTGTATYDAATKQLSIGNSGGNVTFSSGAYYFSSVSLLGGSITIAPGADVTIYTDGTFDASAGTVVNSTLKATNMQIRSTGPSVSLSGGSFTYATIYAPTSAITISGNADAFGSFIGKSVKSTGGGRWHFDRALLNLNKGLLYRKVAWKVL